MQTILPYIGIAFVVVAAGLAAGAVVAYRKLDIKAVRDDLSGRARQSEVRQRQSEAGRSGATARRSKQETPAKPETKPEHPAPVAPAVPRGQDQVFVPSEEPVRQAPAQPAAERPAVKPAVAPARPAASHASSVPDEAPTIIEPLFDEPTSMLTEPMVSESEGPAARPQGAPNVQFAVTKCEIAPDRVDVLEVEE